MIAAVWVLSAVLTAIMTMVVPVDIIWPLTVMDFSDKIRPIILLMTSASFIVVTNVHLFHKISNLKRKARESEILGNEEESTRLAKLVRLLCSQSKATRTLLIVGGIDVIANILICTAYVALHHSMDDTINIYLQQFSVYSVEATILLSHSLTYGISSKEI